MSSIKQYTCKKTQIQPFKNGIENIMGSLAHISHKNNFVIWGLNMEKDISGLLVLSGS